MTSNVFAQEEQKKVSFDQVYKSCSGNKLSIVILDDRTVIKGYKQDVDREKGSYTI